MTNGTKWNPLAMQAEFCRVMDIPVEQEPTIHKDDFLYLGKGLIEEEFREVMIEYQRIQEVEVHFIPELDKDILRHQYLQNLCAELADLIYVICQAANMHGLPLIEFYKAIHEANMQKIDPQTGTIRRREDGKILKPDGWEPPPLTTIYENARNR